MTDTLQAIARALSTDVQTLGTISHNVANMNTPGYRGVRAVPEFSQQALLRTSLDQTDGSVMQTARKLDLALQGPGFFVVEREGEPLLVRSGAFRVDAQGQLVTANGDVVRGPNAPIGTDLDALRVDADGALWDGAQSLGQLELITVADAGALRPAGGGAYRYEGEQGPWRGQVIQGALEAANIDAAGETIRLMETTRHAESVQRAISIYDKAMDTGINRLGDN